MKKGTQGKGTKGLERMYNIDDFIPHRDRMKIIDDIIEVDLAHCVTQSVATSLWPLCDGERINSIIVVELVAQTAAAFVGWLKQNMTKTGGEGVIVGIKKVILTVPAIPVGSRLRTSCKMLVNLDQQYGEFDGEVKDDRTSYGHVHLQTLSTQAILSGRGDRLP
jgi:predicted hotdog family 3-hydroxylacyl-ACP dehydratase